VDSKYVSIECHKKTYGDMDMDFIVEAAVCSRDCPYKDTPWERGEFKAKSGKIFTIRLDRSLDDTDMNSRMRPFFTQEIRSRVTIDTQRLTNLEVSRVGS
jgi:hypothetical protein